MNKLYFVTATTFNHEAECESATRQCEENWSDFDDMATEAAEAANDRLEDNSPYTGPRRVVFHKFSVPVPKFTGTVVNVDVPEGEAEQVTATVELA